MTTATTTTPPHLTAVTQPDPRPVAAARPAPARARTLGRWGLRLASLLGILGLWQLASRTHADLGVVTFANVPAPTEVAAAAWDLAHSPKLVPHLVNSLRRVFAGFAAAAASGILLGLAIGRWRLAEDLVLPFLELLRPIPGVAWIPLAILMFPSSELSMVFITYMGALFPILLSTIHAVEGIDRRLVAAARSLGAGGWSVFSEVILPGAAPGIITGLAIGMGTSWFCLVTAEMIAGQYGIGYYTWESYNLQRYPEILVGMVFIGLFGTASSAVVTRVGRLLTPWYVARKASA